MEVIPFIADSAAEAVAQIRAKLGPQAVVLSVRQRPASGLTRLWQRPQIEVLAYRPDAGPSPIDAFAELKQEIAELKQQVAARPLTLDDLASDAPRVPTASGARTNWRVGALLESAGLQPVHAQRVVDALCAQHGETPPSVLAEEMTLLRHVLAQMWRPAKLDAEGANVPHVFIGPAGAGKTTCLCKWLTQAVLLEGRSAQVWRLDGATANTAEFLSIFCEILGVTVERQWRNELPPPGVMVFIDYPGVDWRNAGAVQQLSAQLTALGTSRVHLVLNAAYETPLLLAQVHAFADLPVADLILTHLDEETRWGKIWNLVLGTNYSVSFLSGGQNIPGDFIPASPERLFAQRFLA